MKDFGISIYIIRKEPGCNLFMVLCVAGPVWATHLDRQKTKIPRPG